MNEARILIALGEMERRARELHESYFLLIKKFPKNAAEASRIAAAYELSAVMLRRALGIKEGQE